MRTLARHLAENLWAEWGRSGKPRGINELEFVLKPIILEYAEHLPPEEKAFKMTLVKWPDSQVCQDCQYGYLLLDMDAGDIACLKERVPSLGKCNHWAQRIQKPLDLGDENYGTDTEQNTD